MALSCPNKSLPEWKRLVDEVGEREALNDYFQFGTIRSPYAVKDKLERLNIANYTNKNFKIGERYFKPTVESLIDVEKNSSVVDAMVTHFGYRGLQSEEDLIKRKFTDDIRPVETVLTQPTTTTTKSQTETVVQELFESDSELANSVYEALGFNFRYTSEKWKDDPTKENKATYINIKGTPSNQEFQVKKDIEEGFYSVHFKTEQGKLTKEQIQTLVDAIASQIPIGGKLSTWGEITKGGISGLNRFLNNGFKKVGERKIKDKEGRPVIIPILEKVEKSNLEQQAQLAYSQYLEQNPNGDIQGFKEFVQGKHNSVKPGVSELFESNPKLANSLYETLYFNNGIEAATMPFSPDNPEAIVYGIGLNGDLIGEILVDNEGRISSSIGQAGVELNEEYRGKGYGIQSYLAVARELAKQNKTLKSEAFGKDNINEAANRVWKSLIKQGYAVDKGNYYEITNLFTPQQKATAQLAYSQYLDTVFPDSKVKDIVYRGVSYKNANFDKKYLKPNLSAFYFTDNINEAKYYGSLKRDGDDNVLEYGTLFPVLLSIKNPYNNQLGLIKDLENIKDHEIYYPDLRISSKTVKLLQDSGYDGYITQPEYGEQHNFGQTTDYKYKVVFEPEQIHILLSKKDLEMFRNFVNNKSSQVENMVDGVPNINDEEKSLKLALKGLTPEEKISFCNHFGITMTEENGTKC